MRCIRAVKSLAALEGSDLKVIALYTDPDRDAPFVRHAHLAVKLQHAGRAVAAYLDHDKLIDALRAVGADAVWPGWGFVAEHPGFVDRVADAGIKFLGPSGDTMRALGDKIASKLLAEAAGVPVSVWSGGAVESVDAARAHLDRIGCPLVIKASAGGGGRGIRVLRDPAELEEAFRSAAAEALSAFGDGRLFLEAMIEGGRHIEVQIAADQHGRVVAVGCRDCSVQRRHQKVIEEAPPYELHPQALADVKRAAVSLATRVGYEGVGTVEFLVRGRDVFFLEMNPRLQVEHGITEELTGADLVQLMIRIARGERLPEHLGTHEDGYAIEARVCAEDPDAGFLPAPGRIARFDPALGPRLRIDTGVVQGSRVPADFDSLIAKVIATGNTREEARARLVSALRDFDLVIEGGATNKSYLLELLESEDYRRGGNDTLWLDRWNKARPPVRDLGTEAFVLAAVVLYQKNREASRLNFFADTGSVTHDKIPRSTGQELELVWGGRPHRVHVYAIGSWRYRIHHEGRIVTAQLNASGEGAARLVLGERDLRVLWDLTETNIRVDIEGRVHVFGRQTAGQVRAAAPSLVVSLLVKVGEKVQAGQPIGVLEAMKMEIGFDAPVGGTVTEIRAPKGQQVAAGDVILVIDPGQDGGVGSEGATLCLPEEMDPLAVLFEPSAEWLGKPDLAAAARAGEQERRAAMQRVSDEIRRIVLGYDVFPKRLEKLIEFLEAPIPEDVPAGYLRQLADVRHQLGSFADVERLFNRMPGELGMSNAALMSLYLRRMKVAGAGMDERFLDVLRRALRNYDYDFGGLAPSERLERAVLRLYATELDPGLRQRLMLAVIHRVTALVNAGLDLEDDAALREALETIAHLRGQLTDAVADAATECLYAAFSRPDIERDAERTSERLERWLEAAESGTTKTPIEKTLADLALAPPNLFRRVRAWLIHAEPRRRRVAVAACVRRAWAPLVPEDYDTAIVDGVEVHRLQFPRSRLVLSALATAEDLPRCLATLLTAAREQAVHALEVVVPIEDDEAKEQAVSLAREVLREGIPSQRVTLSFVYPDQAIRHETTWSDSAAARELYGMHPQAAERLDLGRYEHFDLERLPAPNGIYAFHGRSRELPDDERLFVLVDVRGRPPEEGKDARLYVPIFERMFHEATMTLRALRAARDPERRLQWNRLSVFFAHEVHTDPTLVDWMSHKLYPTTRHLGLERVVVRLPLLDQSAPDQPATPVEIVISDPAGNRMEISQRLAHHDALVPVTAYQRRVMAARRRGLVYPYEIIRMLAPTNGGNINGKDLPRGTFEEYDLEDADVPKARSVAGREYGKNSAGVVFGVISAPTAEVPEGLRRVLLLSDPTRDMGALSGPECLRVIAAIDLAEELGLPLEWLPVSSGARIAMDSGTENLDATAAVVRRIVTFTQAGGVIHVIVAGVNVGAQSYWDALATMLMHTKGVLIMTPRASMVLTGRAALEASGSVSAEDEVAIGGYERIMSLNGQAQYYADDLPQAYRILYQYYRYSYVVPGERGPRRLQSGDRVDRDVTAFAYEGEGGYATVGEVFDDATNPGRKRPFAMRAIMSAVVDQGAGHLERWSALVAGETAIVWDAAIGGRPVCLIGVEGQNLTRWGYRPFDGPAEWNGGTLFPQSSKKIARALSSASGNRPAVVLANLSGFDGSPESMRKLQLEYGAEIARAVVNFEGPIVFLVVSRYHGGAYVVFSRRLNPGLRALAVEGSYASVIGGGPAAKVVFPREVRARVAADPRVRELEASSSARTSREARARLERVRRDVLLEKQAEVAAEFDAIHSVDRALAVGSLERIVAARSLRPVIVELLG